MNDQDFEKIMAYFDQELEPEQRADVEKLLEEDAEARDFLAQLRKSDQFIQGGLNSILDEPVPQHLIDAAKGEPSANEEPSAGEKPSADEKPSTNVVQFPKKPFLNRWAYATAASVTLLVVASAYLVSPGGSGAGQLAQALNKGLEQTESGQIYNHSDDGVQVMPVATFKTAEAGICRQFAASRQNQQTVGLACRSAEGQWTIETSRTLEGDGNEQNYAPASGSNGDISVVLESLEGGDPLSREEEQALMSGNWQSMKAD